MSCPIDGFIDKFKKVAVFLWVIKFCILIRKKIKNWLQIIHCIAYCTVNSFTARYAISPYSCIKSIISYANGKIYEMFLSLFMGPI